MVLRLLSILSLFVVSTFAAGQLTYPPYRQYTLRDGLPQMQVISLFQDSRGYIWVGTKGGISRFNGERFTNFTEKDGLIDNSIHCIAEDTAGKIWISTSQGLASYDGKEIKAYPSQTNIALQIAPAPDGKIWYFGENYQRQTTFGYFYNGEYISQMDYCSGLKAGLSQGIFYSTSNKTILLKNSQNVYEVKDGKMRNLLSINDTVIMIKPANGQVFFATMTKRGNFKLYEYQAGNLVEMANIKDGHILGRNLLKNSITFTEDFSGFPIYTLTPDTLLIDNYHGIQKNKFLIDQNNQTWIGSEEGLYQLHSSGLETFKKEYLPQVWAITEDLKGNMWFASYNYGLKKYDGNTITSYPEIEQKKLARYFYFHPSVDKRGTLYFPNGYGILVYNGKSFRKIGDQNCLTTFYDKDRDILWGGSYKKAEVFDNHFKQIRTIGESEGMEIKRYLVTIGKDRQGYYWLGSFSGLSRYDWETGQLINYNKNNGKLPSDGVITIFNDPKGRTWFGCTNGLLWYDAEKDSVRKVECEQIVGAVNFVTCIDSSWLVVSQPTGIYLMDLQTYYGRGEIILHFFNEKNGFLGIEPGQDGAFTDTKGQIWMTSGTEVVKLNPKALNLNKDNLYVRFTSYNGLALSFNENKVTLPRNEQTVIVMFDAVCFNRPSPVQFSWKIENDKDWSPWQEENYAVITKLPQGNSTILLRSRIPGLPIPEFAMSSLSFQVNIAIWKQEWFFPSLFGLFAFFVLVALILLIRTRIKMTEVNIQSKIFQVQAIQSQMNPHFIFNVLASLQSVILSANMENANNYLIKLANLIRGFFDVSTSTIHFGTKTLKNGELTLNKELEMLTNYIGFHQLIYPGKFDYEFKVDPSIDIKTQTIPAMLIQPFVENAIRHGLLLKKENGHLKITISRTEFKGLNIEIADDGIGIEKAGTIHRQSPFHYVSKGRELTLNRVKLMNKLGYHIQIQTVSSSEGTNVKILIQDNEH